MFLSAVASHDKTLINHNIQNILIIIPSVPLITDEFENSQVQG
jgi:hypothetical protein